MTDEMKPCASFSWSLYVDCPNCKQSIDLEEMDSNCDYTLAKLIFGNAWDSVKGYEVECPHCSHEFELGGVEY